jgi:hypothetical protein
VVQYVIPKEGTARDEGGTAGADARTSGCLAAEMLSVEVKTKGEDRNMTMMICSNGPSLHEKEEVEKFLLAVVARFKAFKKRVPSYSNSKRPQRASASKAKSSVLSQLSGLENVVFNDFIDDELDSEDVSEQRASASLPDSVPIESEEERAAREADEMAALDSVGDYEADPNVMLEDVPQDIVIKTLKVSCACVPVLVLVCVCVCVCVCVRARDVDMCS